MSHPDPGFYSQLALQIDHQWALHRPHAQHTRLLLRWACPHKLILSDPDTHVDVFIADLSLWAPFDPALVLDALVNPSCPSPSPTLTASSR